jgi:CubicO group peptidase (beta-lactamase class C family)
MMLVEEGKVGLADSIVKYFPDAPARRSGQAQYRRTSAAAADTGLVPSEKKQRQCDDRG